MFRHQNAEQIKIRRQSVNS